MANRKSAPPLFACALREALSEKLNHRSIVADALAGLVVGIIALPLSIALAIACGMPPASGLYTAMIAGFVAAACGGSRVQVTGPTAAFVVILAPIVSQYGPGALLLATLLAGVFLVLMGCLRMGKMVEFIPYPVTAGFTLGIAVTIALIQLKDAFGLTFTETPESNIARISQIIDNWRTWRLGDTAVGGFTLVLLIVWGKLSIGKRIPGALVVLPLAVGLSLLLAGIGPDWTCATIDSRFGAVIDGVAQPGVPAGLPAIVSPWSGEHPSGGSILGIDPDHLGGIVRAAVAIALLGAIESLLSAVIADSMTNRRHHADGELVGQGIANMIAPFFGGFAATGALARTAANVRAGGTTPLASMIHAVFIAISLAFLGPALGWLPMASLAALLLVIAKNMADFRHCAFVIRTAPKGDSLVLVVCFALTVGMDMVVAVSVGVVLAALIFMRRMSELSGVDLGDVEGKSRVTPPAGVLYYRVRGPLFFGAAQRAMQEVKTSGVSRYAVIDLSQVPMIDATGIVNLESAVDRLWQAGIPVVIAGANPTVLEIVRQARFPWEQEGASFAPTAEEAFKRAPKSRNSH